MDAMLVRVAEVPPRGKAGAKPEQVSEAWNKVQATQQEAEELERKAEELVSTAEEVRQEAQQTLEEVLSPLRKQRKRLLEVQEAKAKVVAELGARYERAQHSLNKATTKLEEFDAEVEEMGIPIVLLGVKKYRETQVENAVIRTTIKPEMIGAFEPLIITGPRRHGDKGSRCTIEISSDGTAYRARRIDYHEDNKGFIVSRRLSDVTTSPGWIETKDAAYAILYHLGRTDEFPSLQPVSSLSELEVNGSQLGD